MRDPVTLKVLVAATALAVAAPVSAQSSTTRCYQIGNIVKCDTDTQAPPPRTGGFDFGKYQSPDLSDAWNQGVREAQQQRLAEQQRQLIEDQRRLIEEQRKRLEQTPVPQTAEEWCRVYSICPKPKANQ